jgi:hypothetical protein
MRQIGASLVKRADAVMFAYRGTTETAQLRKDEPDPVGPLPTGPQLVYHGIENRLLRRHEALEIELVGHLNGPPSSVVPDSVMRLMRP